MGSSVSKNIVNEALSSSVDITTNVVNAISTSETQQNVLQLNPGCVFGLDTISQTNTFALSTQMAQSSQVQNSIKNAISASIMQKAAVVTQNLTANPGSSEAKNISNLFANLSDVVSNSITQSQTSVFNQLNEIGCTSSYVVGSKLYQTNMITAIMKQIQDSTVNTQAYNSLTTAISQTASCTQQDALAAILMWVAIIIGIIVLPAAFGISKVAGKMVQSPAFWGLVGVGGYGGTAYYFKFWPFKDFLKIGYDNETTCSPAQTGPTAVAGNCPKGPNGIQLLCDWNGQCRLPPQAPNTWACSPTAVNASGVCPCNEFVDESNYCALQAVSRNNNSLLKGSHQCPVANNSCGNAADPSGIAVCAAYNNCSSGSAGTLCCAQHECPCGQICCPPGFTCKGTNCVPSS